MVSEHAASTRGGHPGVYPAYSNEEYEAKYQEFGGHLKCQNPWFLPYEFVDLMWDIEPATAAMV